jgi:hypothetical protein
MIPLSTCHFNDSPTVWLVYISSFDHVPWLPLTEPIQAQLSMPYSVQPPLATYAPKPAVEFFHRTVQKD